MTRSPHRAPSRALHAFVLAAAAVLPASVPMQALAQSITVATAPPPAPANAANAAPAAWKYATKRLGREDVDALLAHPDTVLVLDVRRPDEQITYGSFPVFLSIQVKDLEKQLAWLPKDRAILTVSNHAQRAGAAGDLLAARGYRVAGATGTEDYEKEGGRAVSHLQPPPRAVATAAASAGANR